MLRQTIAAFAALSLLANSFAASAAPSTNGVSVIRDAEAELLLDELAAPIARAAGIAPGNLELVIVDDPEINAFVAGGQRIYVNTGLIAEAQSAEQVQGVIAHELGHIAGAHIIDTRGASTASRFSLGSLILAGVAAAAGAGQAAQGIVMAGQQAAIGKFLAYTREQEETADIAGARYLSAAGLSGRGSVGFFHRLLVMENRHGVSHGEDTSFQSTHPLASTRISYLTDLYQRDPAWNNPADKALEIRFQIVKAKLGGYLDNPASTLVKWPLTEVSKPARVARALAFSKQGSPDEALAQIAPFIDGSNNDPWVLELAGQILTDAGRSIEAIDYLDRASGLLQVPDDSKYRALVSIELANAVLTANQLPEPGMRERAALLLRLALKAEPGNTQAWRLLGQFHAENGDIPRSRLAQAEIAAINGDMMLTRREASAARDALPEGSADALRAADLVDEAERQIGSDKR